MSELVTLFFGPTPITALCHVGDFGCGGGAWTAVMKIDGNKVLVKLKFEHTINDLRERSACCLSQPVLSLISDDEKYIY